MNVIIPEKQREFVQQSVKSGRFPSESDVVSSALEKLMEEEREFEVLKGEIQKGLDAEKEGRIVDGKQAIAKMISKIRSNNENL